MRYGETIHTEACRDEANMRALEKAGAERVFSGYSGPADGVWISGRGWAKFLSAGRWTRLQQRMHRESAADLLAELEEEARDE